MIKIVDQTFDELFADTQLMVSEYDFQRESIDFNLRDGTFSINLRDRAYPHVRYEISAKMIIEEEM